MVRYEALLLTIPTLTKDEAQKIEEQINQTTKKAGGSVISFDRWGKFRLTYPIKKNDYGIYFLIRFEAEKPEKMLADLRTLFSVKLHDLIMRSMVTVLDPKKSLIYNRPQSVEESPSREFLGDSKMKGLVASVESARRGERREPNSPASVEAK